MEPKFPQSEVWGFVNSFILNDLQNCYELSNAMFNEYSIDLTRNIHLNTATISSLVYVKVCVCVISVGSHIEH